MANIYNIQQDLLEIFDQIEANEGEITPELEEQLRISQNEFEDKIRSYACVIRQLECDLSAIKDEKYRLDAIKKSKEKTIERLKQVMVEAIQMFGDTSKTGTKFIDYGTGKVSLRKSESVELDDDKLKVFTNRFISYFNWLRYQNVFDQTEFDCKEITEYCNKAHGNNFDEDVILPDFTEDDMTKIQADLDFRISLKDMITTEEGRALMRAILNYNTTVSAKPVIDKKALKDEIKSTSVCPAFATLITKQSVTIK
uniref:Resistance protein n=1 Tax=Geladintestivirus 6 TaxID=3233138 RepID=A0AAU8MHK0_9CAUD